MLAMLAPSLQVSRLADLRVIAGCDFSTKAVDIVLLDEDTDAATWHRFPLDGNGAFDRARAVGLAVPGRAMSFWDDILAVGIEEPRGYNAGSLYRIQGAILTCIPTHKLVHPLVPSEWRKAVGLPGNASKDDVSLWVTHRRYGYSAVRLPGDWPQDACDAYCIALATRSLIQHTVAA